MKGAILPLVLLSAFLGSCSHHSLSELVAAPEELRRGALGYAEEYLALGAGYAWGGQDPLPRRLSVDCSGLVVRCYGYACTDLGFGMAFADSTAAGMRGFCDTVLPEAGDLIFMGEGGTISHVALFVRREGAEVFFIDSTLNADTDGVSERHYPADDPRFISYGRLRVFKL